MIAILDELFLSHFRILHYFTIKRCCKRLFAAYLTRHLKLAKISFIFQYASVLCCFQSSLHFMSVPYFSFFFFEFRVLSYSAIRKDIAYFPRIKWKSNICTELYIENIIITLLYKKTKINPSSAEVMNSIP